MRAVAEYLAAAASVRGQLLRSARADAGRLVFDLADLPADARERFEASSSAAQSRMLKRAWDIVNTWSRGVGKRCGGCAACQEWLLEAASAPKCDDPRGLKQKEDEW